MINDTNILTMQSNLLAKSLLPYPSKVFAVTSLPEKISFIGHEAIGMITKYLSPDLRTESATVLDASPGKGILSRSLLDAGLPTIHVLNKITEDPNPDIEVKFHCPCCIKIATVVSTETERRLQ